MTAPPDNLETFCRLLGIDRATGARYRFVEELGAGNFGRVVGVVDRDLDREVALKILRADAATDPEEVRAFLAEATITARLEHPNIAPAYDVGFDPELGLYYSMRRYDGTSLRRLLTNDEAVSTSRLLDIFAQICRAVAFAHHRGVVHADLKPENVLVGERGEVLVVDWGLAILVDRPQDIAVSVGGGTARYMSPEQITETRDRLDVRTDIWSLGVLLHEILTGDPPFGGPNNEAVFESILTDERPPVPVAALETVCERALEKPRSLRYTSVDELLTDFDAYLDGRREQARREQLAAQVVTTVDEVLANPPGHEPLHQLIRFETATAALTRGLAAMPEHAQLSDRAARIYWRTFTEIHPGRTVDPATATRATQLMAELTEVALTAIVGAAPSIDDGTADPAEVWTKLEVDPWFRTVRRLSTQRTKADEATPDGLREVVERVELLASVALFADLASHELLAVADSCERVIFGQDEVLFTEGDVGDTLFVVVDGRLRVTHADAELAELGPGDLFGEIAVFGGRRRTASVTATTPTVCLTLEAHRFDALVRRHPQIALTIVRVLSRRIERATEREAQLRATNAVS